MSSKVAFNRHVALGQLPHRYGLHPSAFDYAAACIRLHTLFAGITAQTSTRKNGNNRMQPNASGCARARIWNLQVCSLGKARCRIRLEVAGPEQ